jgi:carbonic anhydrase/acetyltransferase-like protein (isoleucine patch superfamily)
MKIRPYQGITPQLGEGVFVDPSAVVLGDVVLGDDCSVWPQAVVRGDVHRIRIGRRTSIQDGCVLHVTHPGPFMPEGSPLQIGNDVTIGHQAILHGCAVGDRVLIGMGTLVMDGAVVESDVVIAAGSLVPSGKVLKSGHLYVGRPARAIRPLNEGELAFFEYSAANYARLKDSHLAEDYD